VRKSNSMVNVLLHNQLNAIIVVSLFSILFQSCIPFYMAFQHQTFPAKLLESSSRSNKLLHYPLYSASIESEADHDNIADDEDLQRSELKRKFLVLSSYDRGYGATQTSRLSASNIIDRLKALNPTTNASRGIDGDNEDETEIPIKGIWQMIWTTAQDVLLLNASPFSTVGAIYQVITDPPIITNVIDLIPRYQALLPPNVASSLLRLEVTTRARSKIDYPNRIGLTFEKVMAQPKQILGLNDVDSFLPPLRFNLPSLSFILSAIPKEIRSSLNIDTDNDGGDNSPGYFDVIYLDHEMLVIQQNAPGGIFVLVKSDSYDP